jgi:PKD repeat protein
VFLAALLACQGETTTPTNAVPAAAVSPQFATTATDTVTASLTLVPDSQLTLVGQIFQVTARPKNAAGQLLSKKVRWSVVNTAIAQPLDSLKAIMSFKALKAGTTSIKATVDGKSKWSKLVVRSTTGAKLELTPATVSLAPGAATQFTATGRSQAGETAVVSPTWTATGGTVSSTGGYTAGSTAGTFRVIAKASFGAADTSAVTITSGTTSGTTTQVILVPSSATLAAGGSITFSAYGRTSTGDSVSLPVTYSATGGTISSSGVYTAGGTTGSYRVIARSAAGAADTSGVTIAAALLSRIELKPGTAASRPGAATQFSSSAWNTLNQSVSASPAYQTNCGTVTSSGAFTAGQQDTGDCVLTATVSAAADTAELVLLTRPEQGIPMGLFEFWRSSTTPQTFGAAPYTASFGNTFPNEITTLISTARAKGVHLILALTGGAHENYVTNGVFDQAKWQAVMDGFNTPAIRDAVAAAVADGTIIGESVMDEPQQSAGDSKSWGPEGFMTKVRVDGLCSYVKSIFPTLPVGVTHDPSVFEPDKSYQVCEFMLAQYAMRKGDIVTWRDNNLAIANRDKMAIIFSMNVLNGGQQDRDGTYDCLGTGGLGTTKPNCRMTADQVRQFGNLIGPSGCALTMWRYDSDFMNRADNQAAISDIAINLYHRTRRPCTSSRQSNTPPTGGFGSSCDGLTCDFTDSSSDPDGSIASWSWDFDDGASSSARNPSHTYGQDGSYRVTLSVTDDRGATASVSHTVTVQAPAPNTPPTAGFSFSCSDLACSFTDESADTEGPIAEWQWDFGDGSSSSDQSPSHLYGSAGAFPVTLTVTDAGGKTGTAIHSVTVFSGSGP